MRLDEIMREMEALVSQSADDPEIAHARADELLLESLKHVGGYEAGRIREAFERVQRWYA